MYLRQIKVFPLVPNVKHVSTGQSFEIPPSLCQLRDRAKHFVVKEVAPVANELDKTSTFPREIMKRAHGEGFLTANIPKKFGGGGLPLLDSCK